MARPRSGSQRRAPCSTSTNGNWTRCWKNAMRFPLQILIFLYIFEIWERMWAKVWYDMLCVIVTGHHGLVIKIQIVPKMHLSHCSRTIKLLQERCRCELLTGSHMHVVHVAQSGLQSCYVTESMCHITPGVPGPAARAAARRLPFLGRRPSGLCRCPNNPLL